MSENKQPDFGNGKICYIEIPAVDIKTSSDFYKNVFGWNVRTRGDGSVLFDDGVGQVSGVWKLGRNPQTDGGLMVHIMIDNMEDSIKSVIENGCKIVEPVGADLPEITAKFSDPAGNIFGMYQHNHLEKKS